MNKLTVIFITGLMCCVLCGCMSEQELLEAHFFGSGVRYPGTREEYVAAHSLCIKEDVKAIMITNPSEILIGSLDIDDYKKKINLDWGTSFYSLEEKFDVVWSCIPSEMRDKMCRDCASNFINPVILYGCFVRGMSLEQLRVSLQEPLTAEYEGVSSSMYSCDCTTLTNIRAGTDCTIHFTFIDGRLSDWTKIYLPHISEPTYVPPMYYYDADGELHIF